MISLNIHFGCVDFEIQVSERRFALLIAQQGLCPFQAPSIGIWN